VFRPTGRQIPLFGAGAGLPPSVQDRLEGSWASWFRQEILPELLTKEADFAGLYSDKGRPNWSVARLLGLCFLQHLENLSDQEALDALSFDLRWQHALDLPPSEAYLSRRSLVEFRRRLVKMDPSGELLRAVFDHITALGLRQLKLSTVRQRLDSTLITSNIQSRGRLSLARETLRVFLRSLDESQLSGIPAQIRTWYSQDDDGWEQPTDGTEATARLHEIGSWIHQLLGQFAQADEVRTSEPYHLLERLLSEHASSFGVELAASSASKRSEDDDDPPAARSSAGASNSPRSRKKKRKHRKKRRKTKKGGAARFWSPHDPDASCGHKGLGYHVHVTETCGNDQTELLTDYDVVTAAVPDIGQAKPVLQRLRERGIAPDELFADGGYPTPSDLVSVRAEGTELQAPVHRGKLDPNTFSRTDFTFDDEGQVVACPAGHAPTHHAPRNSSDSSSGRRSPHAFFDADTCRTCPHLQSCPVRTPNNARSKSYRLELSAQLIARDARWTEQRSDEWRTRYRIRSGVEATMSELKRAHGLGRLRVRRASRVRLQVAFKATACNLKRWFRAGRRPAGSGPTGPLLPRSRGLLSRLCARFREIGHLGATALGRLGSHAPALLAPALQRG
jgi:hypothetical protein